MSKKIRKSAKSYENCLAWEDDKLNREDLGKQFASFLTSFDVKEPDQSVVIAINAPFGSGKSHFVNNLSKQLICEKYISFTLNVWDTDFSDEPLLAFIHALKEGLSKQKVYNDVKTHIDNLVTQTSEFILKKGFKSIIEFFGNLKFPYLGSALVNAGEKVNNCVNATQGKSAYLNVEHNAVSSYEEAYMARKQLRKTLKIIANEVQKKDGVKTPIFVFIDEMDRCKPTYAIEFLETIKHILSIENFIFIISTDKKQLSHSIKSIYGNNFDALGYLRRFIDYEFSLSGDSNIDLENYVDMRFSQVHGTDKFLKSIDENYLKDLELLSKAFGQICKNWGFTLREINQCVLEMDISLRTGWDRKSSFLPGALAIFIALKHFCTKTHNFNSMKQKRFENIKNYYEDIGVNANDANWGVLENSLNLMYDNHCLESDIKIHIHACLIVAFASDRNEIIREMNSFDREPVQGYYRRREISAEEKAYDQAYAMTADIPEEYWGGEGQKAMISKRIKDMIELNSFHGLEINTEPDIIV